MRISTFSRKLPFRSFRNQIPQVFPVIFFFICMISVQDSKSFEWHTSVCRGNDVARSPYNNKGLTPLAAVAEEEESNVIAVPPSPLLPFQSHRRGRALSGRLRRSSSPGLTHTAAEKFLKNPNDLPVACCLDASNQPIRNQILDFLPSKE